MDSVLYTRDNRGLVTPELLAEVACVGRDPADLHRMLSQVAVAEPDFIAEMETWVVGIIQQAARDCRARRISIHPVLACIFANALRTMSLHGFIVGRASLARSLDEALEAAWEAGEAGEDRLSSKPEEGSTGGDGTEVSP